MTRWKIEIQNYQFKIEHIPGVENIPADAFSRLIHRHVIKPKILFALHNTRSSYKADKALREGLIQEAMNTPQSLLPSQSFLGSSLRRL